MSNMHQVAVRMSHPTGAEVLSEGELVASPDDLGLTRGDGCFEATLVTWDGEGWLVHDLDEHLERMATSANKLGITMPHEDRWVEMIGDALQAWTGAEEHVLKLVLTRGGEVRAGAPLAFCTLTEPHPALREQRETGIDVVTLSRGTASDAFADAPWLLGGVKTLSYAVNRAAAREAAARGADDVIFVSTDGYVLEGPTSAVVWLRDGVLGSTPTGATGILDSITKRKLLGGDHGYEVREELITVDELLRCDGVWLASSGRGASPVNKVDGTSISTAPEATEKLRDANGF